MQGRIFKTFSTWTFPSEVNYFLVHSSVSPLCCWFSWNVYLQAICMKDWDGYILVNWFVVFSSCESLFTGQVFSGNVTELCRWTVRMCRQEDSCLWGKRGEQVAIRGGESVLVDVSGFRGFNCYSNMSFVLYSLMVVYKLPGQSPLISPTTESMLGSLSVHKKGFI